jgi:hypothetical protein
MGFSVHGDADRVPDAQSEDDATGTPRLSSSCASFATYSPSRRL